MSQLTLVLACIAAAVAGAAYAHLGLRFMRDARGIDAAGASALQGFALWWSTLSANMLGVALTYLLAAFGALPFEVQLLVSIFQRILLGLGVAGLLRYLVYLRTGRDLLLPLIAVYGTYVALALTAITVSRPEGVFVGAWRTELTYAGGPVPWTRALNLLVVLPSLVASLAYLQMYRRVEGAHRRYRIAAVGWAIAGWWVLAIVAGQTALLDVAWLQLLHRVASVLTALVVLSAYHPPAWLARRLHRADDRRGALTA